MVRNTYSNTYSISDVPDVERYQNRRKIWKEIWGKEGFREFISGKTYSKIMSCSMRCVYEQKPELRKVRSEEAKKQWADPEIRKKMKAAVSKGLIKMYERKRKKSASKRINDYSGRITQSEFQELSL